MSEQEMRDKFETAFPMAGNRQSEEGLYERQMLWLGFKAAHALGVVEGPGLARASTQKQIDELCDLKNSGRWMRDESFNESAKEKIFTLKTALAAIQALIDERKVVYLSPTVTRSVEVPV